MSIYLGIDTSNYTTSVALYNSDDGSVMMSRKLLPVKSGDKGLRQSDAVFHHVQQLPEMMEEVLNGFDGEICGIGVSTRPRVVEGSYMPCFTVGHGCAKTLSAMQHIAMYEFSHQQGHLAAALYSIGRLDLIDKPHIAFHVSGGTTEALLVNEGEGLLSTTLLSSTLDLNAGQLIDRVGVMMGLPFPCGKALEALALSCNNIIKIKPALKEGDCCLSGGENLCKKLLEQGKPHEYVAKYVLSYVQEAIYGMCCEIRKTYPELPIVFAGGVMSNSMIRQYITSHVDCLFSKPEYSSDNACGVAVLAAIKDHYEL